MSRLHPQEILRRAGIPYVVNARNRQYTTTCPKCRCKYLSVKTNYVDSVCWICRDCGWSGPEPGAGGGGGGNGGLGEPVKIYDYEDEFGRRLFQVLKFEPPGRPKTFRQRTGPEQAKWSIAGVRIVPFMLPQLLEDLAQGRVVFVVEGEKDVLTLRRYGIPATTNPMGAGKWWESFNEFFRNADVVLCGDHDQAGRDHVALVARNLKGVARRLRVLDLASIWPGMKESDDVSDWFDHGGGTAEKLWAAVEQLSDHGAAGGGDGSRIAATLAVFESWLVLPDKTPVLAVLGAVAANYLPGEPVWLGLVAPPSSAKTEILNSISSLPNVEPIATLTVAALLSGTPENKRAKGAKGGLLRSIGKFGIASLKDFGSVLSMHTETRAEVLAALREIFDGAWTRHLGTDGGRTLHWSGKLGLVFGSTPAIDAYHAVIGSLGDRWLLSRMAPVPGKQQFTRALKHGGATIAQMRKELAESVAALFASRRAEPRPVSDEEADRIGDAISLAVRLRGTVERDRRTREIEAIYGAEGTARIGLSLVQLLNGLDVLGVPRETAMEVVLSVARDSVPPVRRGAYEAVCKYDNLEKYPDGPPETKDIALELGLPTTTTRRALEDLCAYGLIDRRKKLTKGDDGEEKEGRIDLWVKAFWER